MNIEIISQKENTILSRKEVKVRTTFEGKSTPSRIDLRKEIAKKLSSDDKLVVIKKIGTAFGNTTADISVYVYSNIETMNKIELKRFIDKHSPKKADAAKAEA